MSVTGVQITADFTRHALPSPVPSAAAMDCDNNSGDG